MELSRTIAAVVVLYNPGTELIGNLRSYAGFLTDIIIIDNSEVPDEKIHAELEKISSIRLTANKNNRGVATALNQGIRQAISLGYDWILTMDQDSYFPDDMFEHYMASFEKLSSKDKTAVIGPAYTPETFSKDQNIRQVNSLITSGSLVNAKLFENLGGYNEGLFIDEVDHEYCYRAIEQGFSIVQLPNISLTHKLGNSITAQSLTGRALTRNLHNHLRLYYMVRNGLYVKSRFGSAFPADMKAKKRDILVRIKNKLLYNRGRLKTLQMVWLGYRHFKQKRFGKF